MLLIDGFIDLARRKDIPHAVAKMMALDALSHGCGPSSLQLLARGCMRILVLIDTVDKEFVLGTGWVQAYTPKHYNEQVLWESPVLTPHRHGSLAGLLHATEFLGAAMALLGIGSGDGADRLRHHQIDEALPELEQQLACSTGPARTAWIAPLTEAQREGLLEHADKLKARLVRYRNMELPPPSPPDLFDSAVWRPHPADFPALGGSPPKERGPPRPCINKEDQENLWRVAYLGGHKRFLPPEDVWLRGPSPIDLQRQGALRRPPGVALSWVENL